MCFSNNAIEQLAYTMSEQIYKHSIYKIIKIEFIGGESIDIQNQTQNLFSLDVSKELPLVTKLVLKGENGILYAIEPNENGLKFAKGQITYKEYNSIQKGGIYKGFIYGSISIATFLLVGWAMVEYFI